MTTFVADLSNNNGQVDDIDFAQIKAAGYACVILKASEGTGYVDPRFAIWAQRAQAAGLQVGAYHFLLPWQSAGQQADLFNRVCESSRVRLVVRCCDAETSGGNVEAECQQFCPSAHCNLLYSGAYFAFSEISQPIPGVDWWIASYGTNQRPRAPWGEEAGWQFTSTGKVPGVPGDCDISIFDDAIWARLTGNKPNDLIGRIPMAAFTNDDDARRYIVRSIFNDELGREPTADEQAARVAQLANGQGDLVLAQVRDSTEAANFRAKRGW